MFLKPSVDAGEFFVGQAAVQHGCEYSRGDSARRSQQAASRIAVRHGATYPWRDGDGRVCPSELASARLK
jgi:hypothetical protein